MTYAEHIRSMTDKELYVFLNMIAQDGPWYTEFDKAFCKNCETVVVNNHEFAFCEIEGNECPHCNGDPLEWWLEKEVEVI